MNCKKSYLQQTFFDTPFKVISIKNYSVYSSTSYTSNALSDHKRQLDNEVMIYRDLKQQNQLKKLIAEFALFWKDFRNVIDVLKKQWMFINVLSSLKSSAVKIYLLSSKNKAVINQEFNKLHKQKKLKWTSKATEYSFSVFVI